MPTSKTIPAIRPFGENDNSFQSAGGIDGISQLVSDFYTVMGSEDFSAEIYQMHPTDKSLSVDKLARFLCGWLGGPKRYREKYGPISIPSAHHPLNINTEQRDAWLRCMTMAADRQPYEDDFKRYLLEQLAVPAERSRTRD